MHIKYQSVLKNEQADNLEFVNSFLGWQLVKELELWPGVSCSVYSSSGSILQIVLIPSRSPVSGKNVIIISTTHCLRDFHEMRKKGVAFKTEPEYGDYGLKAEFEDHSGNYFILLEQRDYED